MPSKKLGKAHSLPGKLWSLWLSWVREKLGPRYFCVIFLTEALCIRVGQAVQLKAEDFNMRKKEVWLAAFKNHHAIRKPLLPSMVKVYLAWKKKGVKAPGTLFKLPKSGYLFRSRRGAKKKHLTKDTVSHALKRVRDDFVRCYSKDFPELKSGQNIRSHSGRRHSISSMAADGIPHAAGMAWSQIRSQRIYASYIDLHPQQVLHYMLARDRKKSRGSL